jgi:urease accessory protein
MEMKDSIITMTPANLALTAAAHGDASLHWRARLQLELQHLNGKTRLARCEHFGPLRVQRPFYPNGPEQAHIYLLHPPGGLVAGDQLGIDVSLGPKANALLTTPSAGKIYNNITPRAQIQQVRLSVAKDACLEWLPQETIVFSGAKARLDTEVHLCAGSHFIGWEIVCLGRPQGGYGFDEGWLKQRFAVYRDGAPLWIEQNTLHASSALLTRRAGLHGQCVYATLVLAGATFDTLHLNEANAPDHSNDLISVTQRNGVTLVRHLGSCTERAKQIMAQYWGIASAAAHGGVQTIPRIWHT